MSEYYNLFVQIDTLLLADSFNNFQNMCLKIYGVDFAHFLCAPGLPWQTILKNTKVKLDLLTEINILLMVEKGIRGGICHIVHQYAKAYNKYINDLDKNKETLYLNCWDVNDLYGWAMSQKLPAGGFK